MSTQAYRFEPEDGVMPISGMRVSRDIDREEVISILRLCGYGALRNRVKQDGEVCIVAADTKAETAAVIWFRGTFDDNYHEVEILNAEEWEFPPLH